MTQGVKDLINAIVEGDAATIDAAFNAEMATRISAKLEDARVSVAQNLFRTEQVNEEVTEEVEQPTESEEVVEPSTEETVEAAAE